MICVTGDHTTPIIVGDHTHEPVPISMSLISNTYAELNGTDNMLNFLSKVKDEVEFFTE